MEGLLYLIDVICVIWLLILVNRNDRDDEAMKHAQLGIFSMKLPVNKTATVNGKGAKNND